MWERAYALFLSLLDYCKEIEIVEVVKKKKKKVMIEVEKKEEEKEPVN